MPGPSRPLLQRLCALAVETLAVDGAIAVLADGALLTDVVTACGPLSTRMSELEFSLGEGPGIDAHREGNPVHQPDLMVDGSSRWPMFAREAVIAGICAVHAFPLRIGGVSLGVLELYGSAPGELSDPAITDGLVFADLAVGIILFQQAGAQDGELSKLLAEPGGDRLQVHQATGMVAVMLDLSVADALAYLRAHAMGAERSLYDVSADVVARRVRFDPEVR